jgi:hypothetical protein
VIKFFPQRLTEPKLKSLFSELKIHDKEEVAWKRLKTEGFDKDGLKEAELRKKLTGKCHNCVSELKLSEVPLQE